MTLFRCMYAPVDFDAARAFFGHALALEVVAEWDDDGRGAIFQAPGAQVELFESAPIRDSAADDERPHRPTPSADEPAMAMAWEVDDVDAAVAAIRERGGVVRSEPADRPWGMRMATIAGPDGVRVSLFRVQD